MYLSENLKMFSARLTRAVWRSAAEQPWSTPTDRADGSDSPATGLTRVIQTFLIFYISSHIYLALQFMRSAFPPAFVGFQPQLRGVLSNRNGGRVTADLGLFVLLCKSYPPYLVTLISHRLCVMVRVHPRQTIIIQIGQAGFWLKPDTCCILR